MEDSQAKLPAELRESELLPESALASCLKNLGRGVKVYAGCKLVPPGLISLGDFSQIDEAVRIYAGQEVIIGRHVHLAFGCSISGGGGCIIDDFAGIGAGVRLVTGTEVADGELLTNPTIPAKYRGVRRDCVHVGAHAVVYTNSVVLPNVNIGEGTVVAAGSVVHRDLKPWTIYAGHPLVAVGTRNSETVLRLAAELLELERQQ